MVLTTIPFTYTRAEPHERHTVETHATLLPVKEKVALARYALA